MDFKGPDLNLLYILDVLLQEKNVTRTGERIHLSQSATSGALARLRAMLSLCDLETIEQGDLGKVHEECEDGRRHKSSSHDEYRQRTHGDSASCQR